MNAGKAIYYLLSNATSVTDICGTRIYPELAEQEAPTPFVVYEVISVDPDDTNDGPAKLDEVTIDITAVADVYDTCSDLASAIRAAIDRIRGTYNGVNVDSVQYSTTDTDVMDSPRRYAMTAKYIVRISRDLAQIATGQPIDLLTILRLADTPSAYGTTGQVLAMNATVDGVEWVDAGGAINELNDVGNVTIDDPLDRQALVYDEATDSWINDGVGSIVIPIRNNSPSLQLAKGTVVQFAGTQGDRILVELWDNASPSAYIVGVLSELLAGGADGHAQTYGELRKIDTSAYALNSILYANAGGTFTTTPNSLPIASVTRVHHNTGRIFIRLYVPGDHYRDRYRAEASAKVDAASLAAGETVETYYTAQADGDAFYRRKLSDTAKNAGEVVRRTYYYKRSSFGDVDTTGYTEVVMDDDSTHDELITAIQTYLNTNAAPLTVWSKRVEAPAYEGPLDVVPGAAVALSAARLLRSSYTGAAINVRRASDNAVQDIGFDGDGELDRSALATFCAGTDGFVVRLYDQSGNGNDLVQGTTANQPKVYDSVTGVDLDNAKPSISYDTTDILEASIAISHVPLSVFIVQSGPATQADITFNLGTTSSAAEYTRLQSNAPSVQQLVVRSVADGIAAKAVADDFDQGLITIISRAVDDRNIGVNGGTFENLTTSVTTVNSTFLKLGGQPTELIKQQEVIVYTSDQSANRAAIEANIATFYGITI